MNLAEDWKNTGSIEVSPTFRFSGTQEITEVLDHIYAVCFS